MGERRGIINQSWSLRESCAAMSSGLVIVLPRNENVREGDEYMAMSHLLNGLGTTVSFSLFYSIMESNKYTRPHWGRGGALLTSRWVCMGRVQPCQVDQ